MNAMEFVKSCFQEKEKQLDDYMKNADSAVGALREKLNLSNEHLELLRKLLDTALTDTFVTLLYALDGEAALGENNQEAFKVYSEDGTLVSDGGELGDAAWEAFHGNKGIE